MAVAHPRKRVLLIDDNPVTREALSMILAAAGYCAALAANGADALARQREHRRPDLVLLDLTMPVLNGHDFRRMQQEDSALASIPILVFSGAERVEEVVALGAAGFPPKPADAGRLPDVVRRCCVEKPAVA